MHLVLRACLSAALLTTATVSLAASSDNEKTDDEQTNDEQAIEETVVVAHPLSGEGLSQAADVLEGEELARKATSNIGWTLGQQPGIHSSDFGSAAGRPVIHGLGGPRVRIMEDRIDALDLSVTSADHAVSVEPFIADRIEVLKGSSALLYGSGAIGGVVDVHTGRIPHSLPEKGFKGGVETRWDNNTDGNTTAAKVTGGVGSLALHADGTWKDGDDYRFPGLTESVALRAEEGELGEEEEPERRLPGSEFDASSYAGGVSLIQDWGFVGIAVSKIDSEYGLPGGHGHEEEHDEEEEEEEEHEEEEEGTPMLDLEQTRTDFELGIKNPMPGFTSLNLRVGYNDYEHQEIEPSGEVATDFSNEAWESRLELVYEGSNWRGAFGIQHQDREFSALGEEAFVPPVDSTDTGIFWVAERDFNAFSFETGLRLGEVEHDPSNGSSRDFTTYAVSAGFVVPVSDAWQLGLLADVSSRAPVAEELYSDGPHLVTNAFEVGDPTLDEERAASLSATVQYTGENWSMVFTAYRSEFDNFIYEQGTGEIEDELPVFQFQQDDATFLGADLEVSARLMQWDSGDWQVRGTFDYVRADLDIPGVDNPPRIPPLRYSVGTGVRWGLVQFDLDYTRVKSQRNVGEQELITPAYEDLRASIDITVDTAAGPFSVFVHGRNLTDDEQRRHTSFIKDVAPAPGRTVEVGARLRF